jgi:hypothetical protein
MGVRLIVVANKIKFLRCSWALPNDSKHNEADFPIILTTRCAYESLRCLTDKDKPITLPLAAHARAG